MQKRWILLLVIFLLCRFAAYGQEDPPWASYYRPDGLEWHHELRCIKTGRTWKPLEEPKRAPLIGSVQIKTPNLWPEVGETLVIQLAINLWRSTGEDGRAAEDVKIMYELKARPGVNQIPMRDRESGIVNNVRSERSKIRGLSIGQTPELPDCLYQGGQTLYIQVPVQVLDNREPQELLLYVCAYQNETLADWTDNKIALFQKGGDGRPDYIERIKPTKLPRDAGRSFYLLDSRPRGEQGKGK